MKNAIAVLTVLAACSTVSAVAQDNDWGKGSIKHVLLVSVDGMHAVDFENCAKGISHGKQWRALLPGSCCSGQDRRELCSRQHFKTFRFLPWPDLRS